MPTDTTTVDSILTVNLIEYMDTSIGIPKRVLIADRTLREVISEWLIGRSTRMYPLPVGVYVVEVFLSSKKYFSQTVELTSEGAVLNFDIGALSSHESHEWAYLAKSMSPKPSTYGKSLVTGVSSYVWKFDGRWSSEFGPVQAQTLYEDGVLFELSTDRQLHMLEVRADGMSPLYVCLPSDHKVKGLVKLRNAVIEDPEKEHPLEVVVGTDHLVAESILSLLTSVNNSEAESLVGNVEAAQQLLYQKVADPVSAAIGGYYLIKNGFVDQMYRWPTNLRNWFRWLPDGPIIEAWQMLIQARSGEQFNRARVAELFSLAYNRGVPIYSEGLRLLYEGLRLLSYNQVERNLMDIELVNMLEKVRALCAVCDFKSGTTTFSIPLFDVSAPFPVSSKTAPDLTMGRTYQLSSRIEKQSTYPEKIKGKTALKEKVTLKPLTR